MKRIIILLLTLAFPLSFLSACADQPATLSATEQQATQDVTETTTVDETTVAATEPEEWTEGTRETVPIATAPDDLDYYEMYKESWDKAGDVSNDEFSQHGASYAKKWISTDGKISFVLDYKYGPFAVAAVPATYTTENKVYDTTVVFSPDYSPNIIEMRIETGNVHTVIMRGRFEYNHEEQSFTVATVNPSYMSNVESYNEKFVDTTVPVYKGGEQVTFKMVR